MIRIRFIRSFFFFSYIKIHYLRFSIFVNSLIYMELFSRKFIWLYWAIIVGARHRLCLVSILCALVAVWRLLRAKSHRILTKSRQIVVSILIIGQITLRHIAWNSKHLSLFVHTVLLRLQRRPLVLHHLGNTWVLLELQLRIPILFIMTVLIIILINFNSIRP